MKRHDRIVDIYILDFKKSSVRGLTVGAPVDFHGIVVGEVAAIDTRFDPVTKEFSIPVEIRFFPERFTSRYRSGSTDAGRVTSNPRELLTWMVDRGFRAQLRTGNLLTGQLYVALDFFPNAAKATIDWNQSPLELPTIPGGLQPLQESIESLLVKLNKVPIEAIGNDVRQTLRDTNTLIKRLDTEVTPDARATLAGVREAVDSANRLLQPDSSLQQNTGDAMRELSRTASAFRTLADYLERHPEALIRGKREDKK
jgi:paraquat-inducible protein B